MRGKYWAGVAATVLLLGGGLLYVRPAFATNLWGASYFPNVPLITQDGTTVHLYDDLLKGKAVAINLIYTSCKDECPLETAQLVQVQRLLGDRVGKDIFFYSISIDPQRDTPAVLKAYAEKFGVGPGWLFLTGHADDIKLVARKLGLSRPNDTATRDGHRPMLMLGNEPTGQWMRNSAVASPKYLATTISDFMSWERPQFERRYTAALRPPDAGVLLFQSRCSACHTIGKGDAVGPDLAGVTTRRNRDWLVRYLKAPDQMLAEKDPIAVTLFAKYKNVPMPNLHLSESEIALVLSYLESQGRDSPARPGQAAPASR
jgi:protein SCO1/2